MQVQWLARRLVLPVMAALAFFTCPIAFATPLQTGGFVINPALSFSVGNPGYSGPAGGFSGIWDPSEPGRQHPDQLLVLRPAAYLQPWQHLRLHRIDPRQFGYLEPVP